MSRFLRSVFEFLSRDLTGKTWERRASHPYFGEMVFFGNEDPTACYWEAELPVAGQPKKIGVTMQGTAAGPEPAAEAFCTAALSDLDALFQRCRAPFEPVFAKWAKQSLPTAWRGAFTLDGFEVPTQGNLSKSWSLCYFVEPAGHYFTARFEAGEVFSVEVDG